MDCAGTGAGFVAGKLTAAEIPLPIDKPRRSDAKEFPEDTGSNEITSFCSLKTRWKREVNPCKMFTKDVN